MGEMKAKPTEEQIAGRVIAWLHEQHFTIYQEVDVKGAPGRADIVAVQGKIVWAIETKTSLGLSVLEQSDRWRGHAHYRSVATPVGASKFVTEICIWKGIGIIHASESCWEQTRPRLNRQALVQWVSKLCPEHQTYAKAGNSCNRYWSPFKATCRSVLEYVTRHEGCTLKELMSGCEHHYASSGTARRMIPMWIREGRVPGVRVEMDGKQFRFYTGGAR